MDYVIWEAQYFLFVHVEKKYIDKPISGIDFLCMRYVGNLIH